MTFNLWNAWLASGQNAMDAATAYIFDFLGWSFDLMSVGVNKFLIGFFDSAAQILGIMPETGFGSSACAAYGNIPSSVIWILGHAQFGAGVATIFSAYGIRFFIRRIPIIG